jgi:hypothetical protein
MKTYGRAGIASRFLTSALDWSSQLYAPAALPPDEKLRGPYSRCEENENLILAKKERSTQNYKQRRFLVSALPAAYWASMEVNQGEWDG